MAMEESVATVAGGGDTMLMESFKCRWRAANVIEREVAQVPKALGASNVRRSSVRKRELRRLHLSRMGDMQTILQRGLSDSWQNQAVLGDNFRVN
jgi:hypothetical protein